MAQSITERIAELQSEIDYANGQILILENSIEEYRKAGGFNSTAIIAKYTFAISEYQAQIASEKAAIVQLKGTSAYTKQTEVDTATKDALIASSSQQKKTVVVLVVVVVLIILAVFIYKKFF